MILLIGLACLKKWAIYWLRFPKSMLMSLVIARVEFFSALPLGDLSRPEVLYSDVIATSAEVCINCCTALKW
jgi:hypothetical protein